MEEQELKNIWMRSSVKEEISIDNNKLISKFKSKMEHREAIVRRRDLKEYIGAIITIPYFIYVIIQRPFSISSLGALLVIMSMIYFVFRLYNNRKSKFTHNLFLPIKEQLLQQRTFMVRQAKLLRTVHWMFIPISISLVVFLWGNRLESPVSEFILTKKLIAKMIITAFMLIYFIYIIRMNKRAAKVNWEPLIKDIDTIITNLDKEK